MDFALKMMIMCWKYVEFRPTKEADRTAKAEASAAAKAAGVLTLMNLSFKNECKK